MLIPDTTEADDTAPRTTPGLGPLGAGRGRGDVRQPGRAVVPQPRQGLGIAHAEPFLRPPAPAAATRPPRPPRARESAAGVRRVAVVGPPPAGSQGVPGGDASRASFGLRHACRAHGGHCVIRVAQDRPIPTPDGTRAPWVRWGRPWPLPAERDRALPARPRRPARTARRALRCSPVTGPAPTHGPRQALLAAWGLRVWAPAPPEGGAPLEGGVLPALPPDGVAAAWERVAWYTGRWLIADDPPGLPTGCALEARQRRADPRLVRLLGRLAPRAVR